MYLDKQRLKKTEAGLVSLKCICDLSESCTEKRRAEIELANIYSSLDISKAWL